MKLSIIIPVFNTERYIASCLNSVLNQNLKDYEIILVNDGSTDNSLDICEKFVLKHPQIKIYTINNSGQSIARNFGVSKASGDFVFFLDSDDLVSDNTLQNLIKCIDQNNLQMIMFSGKAFYENSSLSKAHNFRYERPEILCGCVDTSIKTIFKMVKKGCFIAQPCLYICKREFLQEVSFYPGIIHEDNLFTAMLLLRNIQRVSVVSDCIFLRRVRDGSTMTNKKNNRNMIGYMTCATEILKVPENDNENIRYVKNKLASIWYREAYSIFLSFRIESRSPLKTILSSPLPVFFKIYSLASSYYDFCKGFFRSN